MSLEMCVGLCDGKTFAGVIEGKCLCAEALDPDTRAMGVDEGAVCDYSCPGNDEENCGGLRQNPAMMAKNSTMMPEQQHFTNGKRTGYKRAPAGRIRRRKLPSSYLLSVYGDVTAPVSPAELARPPPPMAFGATETRPALMVTATAYRTVYPLQPAATVLQSTAGSAAGMKPHATGAAMTSKKPIKAANQDNPGSAASYNQGPLSLAPKPPKATGNPAAAAQPAPSIVTVYIKECDLKQGMGSGAPAEPSPAVPPQVPQLMAAGNRVSKPIVIEPDSETAPWVPRRVPQMSRNSRSPDGPDSSGNAGSSGGPDNAESPAKSESREKSAHLINSDGSGSSESPRTLPGPEESQDSVNSEGPGISQGSRYSQSSEKSDAPQKPASPGVPELSEGPGSSQGSGNSQAPGNSGSSDNPESSGNSQSPGSKGAESSQGYGSRQGPGNSQSPESSKGAKTWKEPESPGNGDSKGPEGSQYPQFSQSAPEQDARVGSSVLVAAAPEMRGMARLTATLSAAVLAVVMVL